MQSNALKPETDFVVHGEISPTLKTALKSYIPILAHAKYSTQYTRNLKQPTSISTKSVIDYIGTARILHLLMCSDSAPECDKGMIRAMVDKLVKQPFYERVEAPESILRDVMNTLGIPNGELESSYLVILPNGNLAWHHSPACLIDGSERSVMLSFKEWREASQVFIKNIQTYYKQVYDVKEDQCITLTFGLQNDKWFLMLNPPKSN